MQTTTFRPYSTTRPRSRRAIKPASILLAALASAAFAAPARAGVTYQTTNDWGSGFNGEVIVTNDKAQSLSDWKLEFDLDRNLTSIWDAKVVSHTGNHYTVKSAGWNDVIAAGGKVSFGFGATPGNLKAGPTGYVLSGTSVNPNPNPTPTPSPTPTPGPTPTPPAPTGIAVTITQSSGWNGGFGANLDIQNNGAQPINGWTLKFNFVPTIQSLWNGVMTSNGTACTVKNESWNGTIAPGAKVTLGFSAAGELTKQSASDATLNGVAATLTTVLGSTPTPGNPTGTSIVIGGDVDKDGEALQITIPQGASTFPISLSSGNGSFTAASNNPSVATAQIVNGALRLGGLKAGRAGLRIQSGGAARYIGVRVRTAGGALPGLPDRLSLGSVSEDTDDHLNFWHAFQSGAKNRYVDARYIYLNGGPQYGWSTWSATPGGRAITYIRESKKLGMIPIFVWYNIPDGGESYFTDTEHISSADYMKQYYKLLQLFLDVVKKESPDEPVGIILEPDFLGYLAQNAGKPASQIAAQTSAAYDSGVLQRGVDPAFPNTVQGLVQSINYLISRETPQSFFGWQMNLWASPAGGWTTPVPGTGLMHLTDSKGVPAGRPLIYNEAKAITQYYLDAGVGTYGADFLSIDKYGLDAATAEGSAAGNPAGSTWFWNNDHWNNYLTFVRAMHETSGLPTVLWQLPVGHINQSLAKNPYDGDKLFPLLANRDRQGEDSAPTFFFGDSFNSTGSRYTFFSTNNGADKSLSSSSNTITWGSHMAAAADAGVTMILFGAGVGGSTTNVGSPPSDSLWWIVKAQGYLDNPAPANK